MRKFLSVACAAAAVSSVLVVATPVQAQTKPDFVSPAQCQADQRAISSGQGFDPEPYYNVVQDTVTGPEFKVFIDTRAEQAEGIREGMRRWEEASQGRITMTEVAEPGEGVITVHNDRSIIPGGGQNGATVTGYAKGSKINPQAYIRPDMTDYESIARVGAHELGHVMGLGHTCPGSLMYAFSSKKGPMPISPEVEAILARS